MKDEADRIFEVKNVRGVPVRKIVNVALVGGGDNQIVVANRHVNNSVFEIEIFVYFI